MKDWGAWMNNIIDFKKEESGAEALLKDALLEGFDEIMLVGIKKDGMVYIRSTKQKDMLKALGALEASKAHILEDW
jgi:coenzyme F420-reducing hydrogenase delta subunit